MLRVANLVDFSTVDWPGVICCVVFLSGCPLRCPFCQNSPILSLESGVEKSVEELIGEISKFGEFIEGVSLTGGEPLLQSSSLKELCVKLKELGYKVSIDTSGTPHSCLRELVEGGLVDRIAMDVKAPLTPTAYGLATGLGEAVVRLLPDFKSSLKLLNRAKDIEVEFRTTVVPGLNDSKQAIAEIARLIKSERAKWVINQFWPWSTVLSEEYRSKSPPTREFLLGLAKEAVKHTKAKVYVRTREHGYERVEG